MNPLYTELQWLPRAPRAFPERVKGLGSLNGPVGREIQSLATCGLDLNQLTKLANAICKTRKEGQSLDPLTPFRLAVLSNSTSDMTIPPLVSSAARHGIALEVIQPSYDQVAQEALNPDSKVNRSKPDAVLLALDYRGLPLKLSLGDNEIASTTRIDWSDCSIKKECRGFSAITSKVKSSTNFLSFIEKILSEWPAR